MGGELKHLLEAVLQQRVEDFTDVTAAVLHPAEYADFFVPSNSESPACKLQGPKINEASPNPATSISIEATESTDHVLPATHVSPMRCSPPSPDMEQLKQLLSQLVRGRQSSSTADAAKCLPLTAIPDTTAQEHIPRSHQTLEDTKTEIDESPQEEMKTWASRLEMKKVREV